jgi:hypothetical protein
VIAKFAFPTVTTLLIAACLASGCSTNSEDTSGLSGVPVIPYNHVWSADDGIDLFSRGAELVRAAQETRVYGYYVGIENSYAGFADALGPDLRRNKQIDHIEADDLARARQRPHTNFEYMTDYSSTSKSVSATVCGYLTFPGKRKPENSRMSLNTVHRIRLVNTAEAPGAAGIPDAEASRNDPRAHRRPNWNVFSTWRIVELQSWQESDLPGHCADWWQQQFPTFTRSENNYMHSPPGFELPPMPVAPQYPEWIGPSHPE